MFAFVATVYCVANKTDISRCAGIDRSGLVGHFEKVMEASSHFPI